MNRSPNALLALAAATLLVASIPGPASAQIAVIVNPATQASDVSLDDLRRYFLGKSTTLGGMRVQVLEYPKARRPFYKALLGLSEDDVRRRWVALAFRGEATTLPREIADAAELRRYVGEHPGSIAFVDASAVDASVKVLSVGGRKPSDAGYPLR